MPPVEVEVEANQSQNDEQPAQAAKSTIGIIYPPPEVRNIVDKTASFVARNGPEFETRIRQNELNNPKFNFLNPADPYYAYYKHKVKEFVEGRGQEPSSAPKSGLGFMQHKPQDPNQIAKIVEQIIPKEPPPEFEFVADPPSISAIDIDVVKLTAQFTARNGRQFLTNLMQRESRNYQFDFLRPQHSLFGYFTKLVEQYTKILIPPKDLVMKLKADVENPKLILEQAKYRLEWAKFQDRERKREEDEREKERVSYSQIDWHDFVVVETVDYQPGETGNFPAPTTADEVGARVLAQERYEDEDEAEEKEEESDEEAEGRQDVIGGEESDAESEESKAESEEEDEDVERDDDDEEEEERVKKISGRSKPNAAPAVGADTNVQDMEEDSDPDEPDEEDMLAASRGAPDKPPNSAPPLPPGLPPMPQIVKDTLPQPPPLPPNPEQVLIKRDYNPKVVKEISEREISDKFLISPITGEKIPADKIQEHLRIGLLDPKWIEQRDRMISEKREQEEVYAPGSSIGSSLKQLAERRTDIFGSGTEETQIGKKIGEEEKKDKAPKVIWDGHSGSMEKVSQKARENITIEDQIAVIHKVQGLVADDDKEKIGPAMPKRSFGGIAPPPPPPAPVSAPPAPPSMAPGPPYQPPRPPMIPAPVSRPMNPPAPPRPPLGGGGLMGNMPPGGGNPMMMMSSQPQQQPILGIRPPMPPMMGRPMGHQPYMMMPQGAPPPPMRPPMSSGGMSRPMPPGNDNDDEPAHKKSKTEEQLIPEHVFLSQHQGPVTFRVQVPSVGEKSEWKLAGQVFTVTLPLNDNVAVIKAKIFDETGMPAGKQKLQLDGMFMKDSNTLAFYNFSPMSVVHLQLKERGGRKK